jgi:hypothetical protein
MINGASTPAQPRLYTSDKPKTTPKLTFLLQLKPSTTHILQAGTGQNFGNFLKCL